MTTATRRFAALALPLCLLLAAAPAAASTIGKSGGLLYVSQYGTIRASSGTPTDGGVSAFCPKPYTAIGGGASAGGSPAKTFISSDTNETNRSWYAQAWHVDAAKIRLKTFGICSKSKTITRRRSGTSVPGPTVGNGIETCGSGKAISGGNLTIGEASSWFINSTYPKNTDAWQVYVPYTGAGSSTLLTDVVCTDGTPPIQVSRATTLGAGITLTAKRSCPHGKAVEGGGGFISSNSSEAHIVTSRPYDGADKDKVPDDGWQVKARNDAGLAKTLTVGASCKA